MKETNMRIDNKINDPITFFNGYKEKNTRPWNKEIIHNRGTDNLKPVMKSRARGLSELSVEERMLFDKYMENKK